MTLRTGAPQHQVTIGLRRPGGQLGWFLVNSAPINLPGENAVSGVLCSFSDITKSKQIERALHLRLEEQEAIYQVSSAVAGARTLDQIYQIALTGVQQAAGANRTAILIYAQDGTIRFGAWRGLSESYRKAAEGFTPWSASDPNPMPVLVPDIELDPSLARFRDIIVGEGIRALGFLPLVAGGRLLGRFMIYYDSPHRFEDREVRFLETLSVHVGVAADRQRNEDVLRRSEEEFRQLVEVASDMIYRTDAAGRLLYASPVALKTLDYQAEDLIGQPYLMVVRPDWHEAVRAFYTDQRSRGLLSTYFELPLVSRSGQEIWIGQHVRLVDDPRFSAGFQAIARDVTDRRRTEEALRESEQRFRQLTETIDDVFWLSDVSKTEMMYLSPSFERLWGLSPEVIYQNPQAWLATVDPEDRARVIEALPRQATGEFDVEFRIIRPDGEVRWVRDRAFPLRDSTGQVYRIAGVSTDVTVRRNLEERLRQSQKMEAVGQLAGGVAHDFNNLLTAILGNASLLAADSDLPLDARSSVAEIESAAGRAASLTRQLLTFSRRQVVAVEAANLADIVAGMDRLLHRLLGEDAVLEIGVAASVPMVRVDPGMIEQVIMNLVLNARDAMPVGGRVLLELDTLVGVRPPPAGPGDQSPARWARLTVRDNGRGIPPADLPHIFEPFFTTKGVGQGTGLGLATVFGIVELHGGWIEVDSEVGTGTAFRIHLPAAQGEVAPATAPTAPRAVAGGGETILLVEDEPAVRRLAKVVLQHLGYAVVEADSGPAAVALWPSIESVVDIMVADLVMPGGMSGHDLAGQLRSRRPDLRVLYVSGYSDDVVRGRFNFTPGRDFLQKPYSAGALGAAVRICLDAPSTEEAARFQR